MNAPPPAAASGRDPYRIGLYGGSFDPVHQAHVALARLALTGLALDELRWIPAGRPWQKSRRLAPADDRAAMVGRLIADEPRFRLERCELDRPGPSYTLETVRALQSARAGADPQRPAEWFLIIGADQYAGFDTWFGWGELLQRVTLAVCAREGRPPEPPEALRHLPHRVQVLPLPAMAVSSTRIRALLAAGADPQTLAPALIAPAVADYLAVHPLYRGDGADPPVGPVPA